MVTGPQDMLTCSQDMLTVHLDIINVFRIMPIAFLDILSGSVIMVRVSQVMVTGSQDMLTDFVVLKYIGIDTNILF
jgi:hypothetical protein